MNHHVFTAFFPFCGLGAGARGFLDAQVTVCGVTASFRSVGGVDGDTAGCRDFEYLTGSPALNAYVGDDPPKEWVKRGVPQLTVQMLHAFAGDKAPDVVFMSPPCKGASSLLSAEKGRTKKYTEMNRLAVKWTALMLEAWPDPPGLILLENVPRIKKRAPEMIRELRGLLRRAGYVFTDGFHDCGEVGGLAQHRQRFLLVARHVKTIQPILYEPPKKRVRACGEVLGSMPMPERAEGGPMHNLPRLSWLNWVRLAIIPAGGDWRDIPGVLADGQPRRELFRRQRIEDWKRPSETITGPGQNAVANVADPRVQPSRVDIALPDRPGRHINKYAVRGFDQPMKTIIGDVQPGNGGQAIADPRGVLPDVRLGCEPRAGSYGCLNWREAARTIIGHMKIDAATAAVGDPRIDEARPILVVSRAYDHGYGVLHWQESSPTVAAGSHPGQGAYSVADPRVLGCERFEPPQNPKHPPRVVPVIMAEDGTWHRPLTTYELAMLQGFPSHVNGEPLALHGTSSSAWRERIGNAVPPPTAKAIAEQMLVTLVGSSVGSWMLQGGGQVWVDAPDALEPGWARLDTQHMTMQ